ncbi:MAG: hypothetical protein H0S80_13550 [Desulfovibrionaceae bacterium]|nr:hypothetical protein [Desulfovibrionaceae bacterium]
MGSNSQQALQAFSQGVEMFKEIKEKTGSGQSDTAETQARLLETDARSDAWEAQRKAAAAARENRDQNERERSRERADWGGSNLRMSGSKAVIRDARTLQDMQEEDDVLYEGRRNADAILRQARDRANMLRINGGSAPNRSTLSMGSSIYGPRR